MSSRKRKGASGPGRVRPARATDSRATGLRTAVTGVPADADVIITMEAGVADYAETLGRRVVRETTPEGLPIFEIWLTSEEELAGRQPRAMIFVPPDR